MTNKTNDPFGFQKAINSKALDNPKVLNKVAKMFDIEPIEEKRQKMNSFKKGLIDYGLKKGFIK